MATSTTRSLFLLLTVSTVIISYGRQGTASVKKKEDLWKFTFYAWYPGSDFTAKNEKFPLKITVFRREIASWIQGLRPCIQDSGLTLAERVQQLTDFSNKRPVIKMNTAKFNDLVKGAPRNYSVIAMFTALSPQRGCGICGPAAEEFTIVANSFRFNSQVYSNKLFFALIDFDECGAIFQSMKLYTAPVFVHFPPKGKPSAQDKMDIQRFGVEAEAIARWISERTDIQIRIFRPPNYSGTMALVIVSGLVGGLLYLKRNNLEFLYNRTAWGIASLFIVFCFTSGQMWNQIRSPPVVQRTQKGISYIHQSSQGQLVVETYIVFVLSAAITTGMILLIEAGKGKGDIRKRRVMLVIGLGMFALFFGMILSIFKSKAHGYPYSFIMS